jgi:hypothetical protein
MNAPRLLGVLLPMLVLGAGTALINAGGSDEWVGTLPSKAVIGDGEDLLYEVSWTFFRLGTIRILTAGDYSAVAYVDSYESLPFVDLHAVYFTWMDSAFYSRACRSLEKEGDEWQGLDYVYDFPARRLTVEETARKDLRAPPYRCTPLDTLQLEDTSFVDGVSIAYFPRKFIHTRTPVEVPTVLYGKLGKTRFDFLDKRTTTSIDALDRPVRVVEISGSTTVEGIFGMTGDFRGWFSDDSAAVPIKGRLKVLLGEVEVELVKWNRNGWKPPTE